MYAQILGIRSPWKVAEVKLALAVGEVSVFVERDQTIPMTCPKCGATAPGYDTRQRKWRHLDTCQYKTMLVADVPRVQCPEHGVVTVEVPWAEPGSGFTALFEALVIDWLKEATISAVSRQMNLSWNAIDGIMARAVARGLARRENEAPKHLGIDETSFRKRHDYVTVVSDQEQGHVIHVALGRNKKDLTDYYDSLSEEQKAGIESVSMDMWSAYINATLAKIPDASRKIAFDKFHVAKYLGEAVDKVRREEHKVLLKQDCKDLSGTKHVWLTNPVNMSDKQWRWFRDLRESSLKTARAWALKEAAMGLWHYVRRPWVVKAWKKWLAWAVRCRLQPMKKVAKTIKEHLWGILNAILLKVTNGPAESINSRIKTIKVRSRGFRNKERFRNAIYFHLGGLKLYPEGIMR
ncbi:transposase of ISPca9, ISL3 family [Syntrophotalea carbinolica DSM 2380]|uniref:Transposase of ISPca9, ISL3 family n=1 Tax=Syntrophotalea carbinolica (strain DSM 2380 / NBRC 103641 / GraBd1) TaxID=338963 RepID=Q3A761_SYNC1|nr:ISL3 family transposase [Syntrophotalea carbinolica]ABA87786.1 transposase of ISPca9, ISL3 family [Syntrophotalea carbinolica DSM 2380]